MARRIPAGEAANGRIQGQAAALQAAAAARALAEAMRLLAGGVVMMRFAAGEVGLRYEELAGVQRAAEVALQPAAAARSPAAARRVTAGEVATWPQMWAPAGAPPGKQQPRLRRGTARWAAPRRSLRW